MVWAKALPSPAACNHSVCIKISGHELYWEHGALHGLNAHLRVSPNHAVTHVVFSGHDVWLAGGRCITSAASARSVCVNDPAFVAAAVASTPETVFVMDSRGDVYAIHHVESMPPKLRRLLPVSAWPAARESRTRLLLPPVAASFFMNHDCMPAALGAARQVLVSDRLTRLFTYASITTSLPKLTSLSVWSPYVGADSMLCELPLETCAWHEWRHNESCLARRPCTALETRPTGVSDFVCRKPVAVVKQRRQALARTCSRATFSAVRPPACDAAESELQCRQTAKLEDAFDRTADNIFVPKGVFAGVSAPPPACANNSFLLGSVCIPCSRCGTGSRLSKECTPTDDTECTACVPGTYRPEKWHTKRHCLLANGCPGGNRFQNGVCGKEGYNLNTLWALVLPVYTVLVSRYQRVLRQEAA